jgi:DNA polymerase III epsilon subunit family exonuclease
MESLAILIVIALVAYLLLRRKPTSVQRIPIDHLPETFIVLDLETTGLDANRHEIIEIAAIRYRKGDTNHETIQSLVKPSKKLPKKITEITGITQEMLDGKGEPLADAMREFIAFVGEHRLVTFNAEFDMAFIHAATTRLGLPALNNPVSCALQMARRAWPKRKSFRLSDLASDGEFSHGAGHRALEDARRALIVYAAAVAQLEAVA